jgi:Ca-activated chloride channel family protein
LFERPVLLWLLLLAPLAAAPGLLGWRSTRRAPSAIAALLRLLCFATLVVIVAGPLIPSRDRARGLAVVAMLDQSRSIAPDQRIWMQRQLDKLRAAMGPHDKLAVVDFGRNAQLGAPLDNPRAIQIEPAKVDEGATDIAGALTAGSVIFPPEAEKKMLLLSDGNETQGDALGVLPALVEQGIQVFTAAPPPTTRKRIAISSFEAPNPVRAHLNFALQIAIESDADTPAQAHLDLLRDQSPVTRLPVRLLPGLNRFELPYHLDQPGAYVLTAELTASNGMEVVNGRADTVASVIATPRILVVSADRPMSLVSALKVRDYRVDIITPERMPARAEDYLGYQAVIVDDVSAPALTKDVQRALKQYVGDFGGGLIATGGVLREQNFHKTPLEDALPIDFVPQPPPPSREPLGIYLCIDRSNSMSYNSRYPAVRDGERIRYAKQAAIALLRQLDDSDYVGVIAFDSQPYVLSRLHPLGVDRAQLEQRIMRLEPGGGTDFKEALEIAAADLIVSGLSVRQIILLTDGDTNRQYHEHDQLIADLSREKIPVSTVRIGPDQANLRLLEDFAEATGGIFYRVQDIEKLPQLFIRLSRQAMQTPQRQTKIMVDSNSSILRGIKAEEVPSLEFFSVTQAKDGASVPLSIERNGHNTPLLVAWQYGLGRSAIFAADPDSLASIGWIHWNRYAEFWSQLVGWTMRQGQAGPFDLQVRSTRSGDLKIQAESSGVIKAGDLIARISGPYGASFDIPLTQVGDALYRAQAPAMPGGKYQAQLIRKSGKLEQVLATQPFAVPATRAADADELSLRPANIELLRRLAAGSNGGFEVAPRQMLRITGSTITVHRSAAPYLIPLAILLLLGEVFVRRCLA